MSKRILFLGDAPDCPSGLARIGRDLAIRLHAEGADLAYMGYWGLGNPAFGFPQFTVGANMADFTALPLIYDRWPFDVLFTIYDVARVLPVADPNTYVASQPRDEATKEFLLRKPFELWGYFPIDAHGPGGRLTGVLRHTLEKYDRVLAYGPYGAGVLKATLGGSPEWLPHGLEPVWSSEGPTKRDLLVRPDGPKVGEGDPLLGVVATNQPRKDWGTTFAALALLRQRNPRWKMWFHTDKTMSNWSLPALAEDHGVEDAIFMTAGIDDYTLAALYRSCDVTFGPGLGEGFGFPLVESMMCGTPCVHVNYAGGADLLPPHLLIEPKAFRYEGAYDFIRPVLDEEDVADAIEFARKDVVKADCVADAARYAWPVVWPQWREWFKAGGVL